MKTRLFVAMKAFIVHDGKVLLLREAPAYEDGTQIGKYDVVGGRVTPGEACFAGLAREIEEETGLDVTVGKPFFVNEVWPVVREEQWQIVRVFFCCDAASSRVVLSEDHDSFAWIDPRGYEKYNVISNLRPVFASYLENFVD